MEESAKSIFKKANLSKVGNRQVIKYDKINKNIVYELTKNSYEPIYYISFVEKKENEYIYIVDKCKKGDFSSILQYIKECKEKERLI